MYLPNCIKTEVGQCIMKRYRKETMAQWNALVHFYFTNWNKLTTISPLSMNVWINYANLSKINISQCHASYFDQEHRLAYVWHTFLSYNKSNVIILPKRSLLLIWSSLLNHDFTDTNCLQKLRFNSTGVLFIPCWYRSIGNIKRYLQVISSY